VRRQRPLGVDLLGIILLINGLFAFLAGLDLLGIAALFSSVAPINAAASGTFGAVAEYAAVWGSILMAIGIGSFVVASGLFYGRGWAWSGAIALAITGIVIPIINIIAGYWPAVFTMIISGLIIYYLTRHEVRLYFGRKISTPSDTAAA
jgi:hypothetical protein